MPRSLLENVEAFGFRIKRGFQKQTAVLAITADQALVTGMPVIMMYDPGNTARNITLEAVTASAEGLEKEIYNFSTGTGILTLKNNAGTAIATIAPGQKALCKILNQVWVAFVESSSVAQSAAAKSTVIMPIPLLAGLANSQVYKLLVPYAFTLTSIGFRVGVPATTAAKLATITAQINGVACTGGVISLTSATATPTGLLTAGTAITALNTGSNTTIEAAVSAVTAFVEGGGWIEFGLTDTGN